MSTKLHKTIAADKANMKNAFSISVGAGKDDGQPFPFNQHDELERDGATSTAPFVESNIVDRRKHQRTVSWLRHLESAAQQSVHSVSILL